MHLKAVGMNSMSGGAPYLVVFECIIGALGAI